MFKYVLIIFLMTQVKSCLFQNEAMDGPNEGHSSNTKSLFEKWGGVKGARLAYAQKEQLYRKFIEMNNHRQAQNAFIKRLKDEAWNNWEKLQVKANDAENLKELPQSVNYPILDRNTWNIPSLRVIRTDEQKAKDEEARIRHFAWNNWQQVQRRAYDDYNAQIPTFLQSQEM